MPRNKLSGAAFVKTLEGSGKIWDFLEEENLIVCKLCPQRFDYSADNVTFRIKKHVLSEKHKRNYASDASRQQKLAFGAEKERNPFYTDLLQAFIAANIPLKKLENKVFSSFLEVYTGKKLPDESTLRKNYLGEESSAALQSITTKLKDKSFYVQIDECTDSCGRFIIAILIGSLEEGSVTVPYLVEIVECQVTNHSTIIQVIMDTLYRIFGSAHHEKFTLLLSDGASYMIKAGKILKETYPKMLHVTCLAHCVQRLAEFIKSKFERQDKFIKRTKAFFKNNTRRLRLFKERTGLTRPPQPVESRWGTWLGACFYISENFDIIAQFYNSVSEDEDCVDLRILIELCNFQTLKEEFDFVSSTFRVVHQTIERLQARVNVIQTFGILQVLIEEINFEPFSGQLKTLLDKNPDFAILQHFEELLKKGATEAEDYMKAVKYRNAPLVSCEIERLFSVMNATLTNRRQSLTVQNLKHILVLNWYLNHCN